MPGKHALLSPSSLYRWGNCQASPLLSKGKKEEASPYAEEGTLAHKWAECVLKEQVPPLVTSEMASLVGQYIELCQKLRSDPECKFSEVEAQIDISKFTGEEGAKGTIDFLAQVGDTLHVVDLKYGQGVKVEAKENPQLSLYGVAALELANFWGELEGFEPPRHLKLTIVQPRLDHIDTWEFPLPLIPHFTREVGKAAERCLALLNGGVELSPNDFCCEEHVCQFCLAKADCPEMRKRITEVVQSDFEVMHPERALVVPADDALLAKYFGYVPIIRQFCDAVEKTVKAKLLVGQKVPGFKLVPGRQGNRKWSKPQEVENILKKTYRLNESQMYDRKLISPTKAEKLMKSGELGVTRWNRLQEFIERTESQPIVVPETDPRKALIVDDFEKLEA